jgi:hypothetical protein
MLSLLVIKHLSVDKRIKLTSISGYMTFLFDVESMVTREVDTVLVHRQLDSVSF